MKKKEMSNFVVYLFIFFLTMIIAIPPLFRVFVPREDKSVSDSLKNEKLVLLTCSKTSDDGLYQIDAKTKFKNGNATNVKISYTIINTGATNNAVNDSQISPVDPNMTTSPNSNIGSTVVNSDFDFFRGLMGVTITDDASHFTVEMTPSVLKENSDVPEVHNYFNLLPNQRKHYESLGYVCTKIES